MDSGAPGTNGEGRLTNGEPRVTSGISLAGRQRLMLAGVVVFAAIQSAVNGISRHSDLRGAGSTVAGWMVAVDETSSFFAWLACMAVIWRLVAALRPPLMSWPAALAIHLLATVPVSLLHIALMVLFREGAYAVVGVDYDFAHGSLLGEIVYEYRKDGAVYVLLAAGFAAIMWATRDPPRETGPKSLVVQDGIARHSIPVDQIGWVEAAGNYVTIHWEGRQVLHRCTLTGLVQRLGGEFARIHRSRLVRKDIVRTIEFLPSGDFTVTLADGTQLRGSRRYRSALE